MTSRKHSKLKRHPLVRLIRAIFRLIRVLLKPKKRISRSLDRYQSASDERSEIDAVEIANEVEIYTKDPLTETVGELLDRVKWQIPLATIQERVLDTSTIVRTHDVSIN
jgi:hypothetical protein